MTETNASLGSAEANKTRVRDFFEALNQGDVEAFIAMYDDEGDCWTAQYLDFRCAIQG